LAGAAARAGAVGAEAADTAAAVIGPAVIIMAAAMTTAVTNTEPSFARVYNTTLSTAAVKSGGRII